MLEGLIYGTNHSLKWDREYFIEYITEQGFVRTDKTPYEGVKRLPAHILIMQEGRLEVKKYWDIEQIKTLNIQTLKIMKNVFVKSFPSRERLYAIELTSISCYEWWARFNEYFLSWTVTKRKITKQNFSLYPLFSINTPQMMKGSTLN